MEEERRGLRGQIEALEAERNSLKRELADKYAEIERLKKQIQDLNNVVDSNTVKMNNFKTEIDQLQKKLDQS